MELRQLRYFIAVADDLSFSRAAVRLRVSQPPLSRQIANLEAELGTHLLNRHKSGVSMTEAGKVYYAEALKTLAAVNRTIDLTQRAGRGQSGALSLGFGGSAAYTFAPRALRTFRTLYPDVELSLHNLPMTAQVESLRQQIVDVAFVMLPVDDETFHARSVLRDRLMVAVPSDHSLAKAKVVGLRELEPYDMVTFPRSSGLGFYTHVIGLCKRAGFAPNVVQEVAPIESVIGLVAAGVGVAIVPSVAQRLRITDVEYRPLRESYATMNFAIAWRRDNTSPVVKAFLDLVLKMKR